MSKMAHALGAALLAVAACLTATIPALAGTRPLVALTNDTTGVPSNIMVPLSGIGAMIANDLPPLNNDGTANQTRQDNAVTATVNAAVTRGLLPPPNTSCPANVKTNCYLLADYQGFALAYAHKNSTYADVRPRTTLITYIEFFLSNDLNPDGTINWSNCNTKCVNGDVADLIKLALDPSLGTYALRGTATQQQLTDFSTDLAHIVDTYNKSGG